VGGSGFAVLKVSPYSADVLTVGGVYLESRLEFLRKSQNANDVWGYFPGKQSWFEPTTYTMLALHWAAGSDKALGRPGARLVPGSYRMGVSSHGLRF
jgi:hypothetical protein